jgi:hypothetical protein
MQLHPVIYVCTFQPGAETTLLVPPENEFPALLRPLLW